jgi:homoserine kinase
MAPDRIEPSVTAFAPATVANVGVGFDVLGFALEGVGDRVHVARDPAVTGLRVEAVEGVVRDLPIDPERNTATVAIRSLFDATGEGGGFRVRIHKGIALGSGMGGSAASAVAAVVAANRLLDRPLGTADLLRHAVAGERVASGAAHADNAAACLFGGLVAVVSNDPLRVVPLPVPRGVQAVVVRPDLRLETRAARAVLPPEVPLARHVEQSQLLAGFLAGCFAGDVELIGRSMEDRIATPARARLIPGYERARAAAREAGAIGFGIAGAGPSVFAWTLTAEAAARVERDVRKAFTVEGLASEGWRGPLGGRGAHVEERR